MEAGPTCNHYDVLHITTCVDVGYLAWSDGFFSMLRGQTGVMAASVGAHRPHFALKNRRAERQSEVKEHRMRHDTQSHTTKGHPVRANGRPHNAELVGGLLSLRQQLAVVTASPAVVTASSTWAAVWRLG
jgi:hypothetical protein